MIATRAHMRMASLAQGFVLAAPLAGIARHRSANLALLGVLTAVWAHMKVASLAMGGVIMMLVFGISSMLKKPSNEHSGILIEPKKPGTFRFVIKGFALNTVNPSVFLFWIAMITVASVNENYTNTQVILFISSIIFTVFLTDLSKAYVAIRLKQYLTFQLMAWMNWLVGITLFGFGIRLIYYALKGV